MELTTKSTAKVLAAVALTALVAACDQRPSSTSTPPPKPDNTANNARDRDGTTVTPIDQSESAADIGTAAEVRKALMDDSTLSTNAKNVKIIVRKGTVTLRGVVDSQAEKDLVESRAKGVSGVNTVVNEIEVKQ